jgi:hypothetical protein
MAILLVKGIRRCCPALYINIQINRILSVLGKKAISRNPALPKRLANTANRRLRKKKSAADINTTRNPGSSRGNSRKVRCRLVIEKFSLRKLFSVELTTLSPKPSNATAEIKRSSSSLNRLRNVNMAKLL